MDFLMKVVKYHVIIIIVALAIMNAPFGNNVKFTELKNPSTVTYPEGEKFNLNNGERLFDGVIRGPETFAIYKKELYMSAHGGYIYKLNNDKLIKVLKTGKECDENSWHDEVKCGRPLGLCFDQHGILYIADAYNGIFKTDLSSGKFNGKLEKIISLDQEIAGVKPVLPNSLDVASDGVIYWSDSSTTHTLNDGLYTFLHDGDGRLLKYDPATQVSTVLIKNLMFANGVVLSKDESFVLVAETVLSRVHKYHLKGPKAGSSEIFLDNLPGFPDNMRLNRNGNIVISLINPFNPESELVIKLRPFPSIRKLLYKCLKGVDLIFMYLKEHFSTDYFSYIQHLIGHFESISFIGSKDVKAFIVDNEGTVLQVFKGNDGSCTDMCDLIEYNNYYYLGSPFASYLGRVKMA